MLPPGAAVYIDTNVYRHWADGKLLGGLRTLRRRRHPIFLSPTVIIEGMEDFWFHDLSAAAVARRALRLMLEQGGRRILPPAEAVVRMALSTTPTRRYNVNLRAGHQRRWLRFAARLPLFCRNTGRYRSRGFDIAGFERQINDFRDGYTKMLIAVRDGVLASAGAKKLHSKDVKEMSAYLRTPDWREVYFRKQSIALSPSIPAPHAAAILERVMHAGFAFDTEVLRLVLTSGYKPENHPSDAFDRALLTHLADPRLHFITADAKMVGRVAHSPQRSRIILLRPQGGDSRRSAHTQGLPEGTQSLAASEQD